MERRIPSKPQRPQVSDEAAERFINQAPDAGTPAAAQPVAAAQPDEEVPRKLRKRKEPVTMTLDPVILSDFDDVAAEMGLSRAAATGMAMKEFIHAWRQKHPKQG